MIIPDKFQFSSDEDAREKMTAYIKSNFADVLGPKINLIDAPNGLDLIQQEVKSRMEKAGMIQGKRKLHIA